MTKEEIVLETIEYYKTHPRSVDNFGKCVYKHPTLDTMCAFGRCMVTNEEIFSMYNRKTIYQLLENLEMTCNDIDLLLQEKYWGHDYKFWKNIQSLHDFGSYWEFLKNTSGNELTTLGKEYVQSVFGITL
jgi:hypothetical protein